MSILQQKFSVVQVFAGDFTPRQRLILTTFLFGVPIWYKNVKEEIIPDWALIQLAELGYTTWVSKFFKHL